MKFTLGITWGDNGGIWAKKDGQGMYAINFGKLMIGFNRNKDLVEELKKYTDYAQAYGCISFSVFEKNKIMKY